VKQYQVITARQGRKIYADFQLSGMSNIEQNVYCFATILN